MNIAAALKRVRFEKNMNQQDVAKKAKVSQTYLSMLENGKKPNPSQYILKKLCKIYDVPQIVLAWYGTEEKDIKPDKLKIYKQLHPAIDVLVKEIVTK